MVSEQQSIRYVSHIHFALPQKRNSLGKTAHSQAMNKLQIYCLPTHTPPVPLFSKIWELAPQTSVAAGKFKTEGFTLAGQKSIKDSSEAFSINYNL